ETFAFKTGQLIFDQDKVTYKQNGITHLEGKVDLDPTTSVKQLDQYFTSGRTDLTIYVRAGDYLIQCGNVDSNRLSGKKSKELSHFFVFFRILEHGLSIMRVGSQAPGHSLDGSNLNPSFARGRGVFIILAQAPIAIQASNTLLHHPANLDGHEARRLLGFR